MKSYLRILQAVVSSPWAILPAKLEEIEKFLIHKVSAHPGEELPENLQAARQEFEAKARPSSSVQGNVAVLPLFGVLAQRMDMMDEISGGTSTEAFAKRFQAAVNDPAVKAIVINIDSPGGSVYGTQELGEIIYQAREKKHIVAIANSLAASAAYWIGTAADDFVVTPSGQVGSIGVITVHHDYSEALAKAGIKSTIIQAGKYKSEGTNLKPLDEEALGNIQADIDVYYDAFVKAVARNRGVTPKAVRGGFGQGRVLTAEAAKEEGMVDRVDTLDGVLSRLGVSSTSAVKAQTSSVKMAAQQLDLAAQ